MKFFVKTFVGHIDVFDLEVTPSQLERIKAEIFEETAAPPEDCLYFPESRLWNGGTLSEQVLAFARTQNRSALAADGVAARPGDGRPDTAAEAGAAETPASGPVTAETAAVGAVAAVGARGSDWGYASLSEDGWAGHGAGSNTSGASDGRRPRCGAAAPKGRSSDGKGHGSARQNKRGGKLEEDRGKVTLAVTEEEAKLVSEDLEFRWVGKDSIEIASFKKQAPVPRTVPGADKELPTCLFFPGEGCQYKGMCRSVHALPGVLDLMERASKVLGYDVVELCHLDPGFRLSQTRYCQPLVFVAGMAALEKLKVLRPEAAARASVMAGFGVGQFTALCAAGVLGFEDMLRLVQVRAEAMEETCSAGKQLMLICVGLDARTLTEICLEAEQEAGPGAVCRISGHCHSKPPGYSLGGTEQAVLLAKARVERAGALMARLNNTQVASETQLMARAGTRFFPALDAASQSMKPPSCTAWSSVGPRPFHAGCSPLEIVEDLKAHLTKPCLWEALVRGLQYQPVGECYELAPSAFIKSMILRIDQKLCQRLHNIRV
mmetsp:Transcript_75765/g.222164  ORF Transcript_75765/g.222164 Transcript_75765/m.222164 type:complete len:548 (-) Transcript_75765:214-1857(-)